MEVGRKENRGGLFKYLGFLLKKNGDEEGHVRDTARKVNIVMKKVWVVGERWFRGDFKRRMWLFRCLVAGLVLYGAEVWGWKEKRKF